MNGTYRVAVIGCGGRGRAHIPGLVAEKRAQVVALSDPNLDAAERMNTEGNFGAELFTDHREMLAKVKPDVVITCLWTALHLPVFRDCVEAGVKAVLSEKPMAPTWDECQEMARLAEESGVQLSFCHQRRFAPGNLLMRRLLKEGVFGEVQRMDLFCPPHLLDCGTHSFDQAMSFNGESRGKWILAGADIAETVNFFQVPAESTAVGTVVFENGVRASFQYGGPDLPRWSGAFIYCTKGWFFVGWDGDEAKAVVYDNPSYRLPEIERPENADIIGTVKDIFDSLEAGTEPELSWHKALRSAEIIFAGYESIRSRRKVSIPPEGFEDNPLHALLSAQRVTS